MAAAAGLPQHCDVCNIGAYGTASAPVVDPDELPSDQWIPCDFILAAAFSLDLTESCSAAGRTAAASRTLLPPRLHVYMYHNHRRRGRRQARDLRHQPRHHRGLVTIGGQTEGLERRAELCLVHAIDPAQHTHSMIA